MRIFDMKKIGVKCACGCRVINLNETVNKINGKYFRFHCGRIYRLHTESIRWIRGLVNV